MRPVCAFRFFAAALLAVLLAGFAFPAPALAQTQGTVSGIVTFDWENSLPDASLIQPLTFIFASPAATPGQYTYLTRRVTLDNTGSYTLSNIPVGSYTVWIKGARWLARAVSNVSVTTGNTTVNITASSPLASGDATNDNGVDVLDFGTLVNAYGSSASDGHDDYDPACDFNCDSRVDVLDFGLLVNDYNDSGDPLPGESAQQFTWRNSVIWDLPAPDYGASVVPMDAASAGGAVNLTSGVYENSPGADLDAFNPVGPSPAYSRTYHSGRASQGYGSPGLSPGWIDNYDYTLFAPPLPNGGYGPLALIYPNGAIDVIQTPASPVPAPVSTAATALSGGSCLLTAPAQVPYFVTGNPNAAGVWADVRVTFADNMQMVFTYVGNGMYRYTALADLKHDAGTVGRILFINRNANGSVNTIVNDDTRVPVPNQILLGFDYNGDGSLRAVNDVQNFRTVRYDFLNFNGVQQLVTVHRIQDVRDNVTSGFLWGYNYQTINTWSLLSRVTVPDPSPQNLNGRSSSIAYDAGGRVSAVQDSNNHAHVYTYGLTATTVAIKPDALPATPAIEQWMQVFSRNRDAGFVQDYAAERSDGTTLNTHVTASISYYAFGNPYLVSAVTDTNGIETDYDYDAQGNIKTVNEPVNDGHVSTKFTYNPLINPLGWVEKIETDATTSTGVHASKAPTTFSYYTDTTLDGNQQVVGLRGQLQAIHSPAPGLQGVTETTFTYTALGNLCAITAPSPDNIGTVTTKFVYDKDEAFTPDQILAGAAPERLGLPIAVAAPFKGANYMGQETRTTRYRYDGRGNLVTSYHPLALHKATTSLHDYSGEREDYQYNLANQPTYAILPALRQVNQNPPRNGRVVTAMDYQYIGGPLQTVTTYDDTNNIALYDPTVAPPLGVAIREVATGYGAEEEVKSVSGSLAGVSLTYDAAYRLTGLANAANKASAFRYDRGGNLFQHTWPGGKHVAMTRDAHGNLASLINARGTTATLTYSGDHTRVAGVTYSGSDHSLDVTYTYDAFGRLSQMKNATAQLDYAYDDLDNVTDTLTTYLDGLNRPIPLGGPAGVPPSQQTSSFYGSGCLPDNKHWGHPTNDPLHPFPNRNGMPSFDPLFPNGYDKFDWFQDGRIHDVTHHVNDVTFHNSADYDEDGHLTKDNTCYIETTFGQGDACTLASMDNVTGIYCPRNNGPLPSVLSTGAVGPFSYSNILRDPLGHLLSMEATAGDAGSDEFHVTITYGYDDQNHNSVMQNRDRLLGEQYAGEHKVFFLDPNGHPQHTVTPFGYINGYTPDAADNLTQVRSNVNNPATYTFNEDNQITNAGFAYDEDGNLLHTPVAALQYDAANHLTAYGANQLTFGYRPDGLRAWKQNGSDRSSRTYYFYEGTRLLYEMTLQTNADASATDWQIAQYYGWGVNGLRQAWTPQDGEIDYAFDPQGNVSSRYTDTRRRTEGGSGWGVARIYDAYGQLRFGDRLEAQSDAVGYNGQSGYYTDVPSLAANGSVAARAGLVLCTYRYYSPDLARWLTRDPIGYEGGINVYAYCEDNPVGMIDPLGLDAFDDLTSLMSGWGSGVSFGLTDRIQDWMGTGQYVNRDSGYYYGGEVIGTVHQILISRNGGCLAALGQSQRVAKLNALVKGLPTAIKGLAAISAKIQKYSGAASKVLLGIAGEIQSARWLHNAGYIVEFVKELEGVGKQADLIINGKLYDVYSPLVGTSVDNILKEIISKGKTFGVVLNNSIAKLNPTQLKRLQDEAEAAKISLIIVPAH